MGRTPACFGRNWAPAQARPSNFATAVPLALLGRVMMVQGWFGATVESIERLPRFARRGKWHLAGVSASRCAGRRASSITRSWTLARKKCGQCSFGATTAKRGRYLYHELPSGNSGILSTGDLVRCSGPACGDASDVGRDTATCRCVGCRSSTRGLSRPRVARLRFALSWDCATCSAEPRPKAWPVIRRCCPGPHRIC